MRRVYGSVLATAALFVLPTLASAQDAESSRKVAGGGITAAGWMGKIDAGEAAKGATIKSFQATARS